MQALDISRELTDIRAERAVLRLLARGLRMVRPSGLPPISPTQRPVDVQYARHMMELA